jgi:hypothetical protein
MKRVYASVERVWPGETFVCVGTGPSLTARDVDFCRGKARVIAINDAYKLAPWADVLYACDNKWWGWADKNYKGQHPTFHSCTAHTTGHKYGLKPYPGVRLLRGNEPGLDYGLSLDPGVLRTGFNSGYQAINLAVLFGAVRVVLLGYDMRVDKKRARDHFFGQHPDHTVPAVGACLTAFKTLVKPLQHAGVEIINCTPGSALQSFSMRSLAEVLADERVEVAS